MCRYPAGIFCPEWCGFRQPDRGGQAARSSDVAGYEWLARLAAAGPEVVEQFLLQRCAFSQRVTGVHTAEADEVVSVDQMLALLRLIDEEGRVRVLQTGGEGAQTGVFQQHGVAGRFELRRQFADHVDPEGRRLRPW